MKKLYPTKKHPCLRKKILHLRKKNPPQTSKANPRSLPTLSALTSKQQRKSRSHPSSQEETCTRQDCLPSFHQENHPHPDCHASSCPPPTPQPPQQPLPAPEPEEDPTYIPLLPTIIQTSITKVPNVESDGHCGF
ncbi:hypothetical protein KEM48_003414 [Puccinia striiformis f. sp. tritici PST-130]|nr:hypothetical protein KEM48_003414 [Puccinia striiformis f. sp. tritici PST-130]